MNYCFNCFKFSFQNPSNVNLVFFRGNFLLLTFYLLVGLLFSCNTKLDNSATITFKKGDNSETCEVLLKLSDGKSKIIDTFTPRVDGWPEEGRRILYSNISENKNLNFLYVDTVSPTGYGKCIGVYASINNIYAWEGAEFAQAKYYKYYLFESDNKIRVLKEQWSDLDENSGGIDNRGIFNSKSTPTKGTARKIGESALIFDSDVSSLSNETTSNSKIFEFGGDFSEMYFSMDSLYLEEAGYDEYLLSFKNDKIEITLIGIDDEPKIAEIIDNHITYNNHYYYKIEDNNLKIYYYDDVRTAYLGEGTPIFDGDLVWSKSKLKEGVVVNKNSGGNNSNEPNTVNKKGLDFKEIQLNLLDGSLKKAKIYLGEPDKYEFGFGHLTKGFAIYYNKVANQNGNPKHLVLFLRINGDQWGNNADVEEIYSIEDNQKACFGIHCLQVANGKIKTNAANLDY